jgi:hypothetical protein
LRAATEVEEADYAFVYRVALDCLPQVRLQVVEVLEGANDYLTTSQVAGAITYPTTTARRTLEDLAAIGIVAIRKAEKQGQADNWQLADEARALLNISTAALSPVSEPDTKTGSVPPMSAGGYAADDRPPTAPCSHRPPGEVEDRWAHGDGGADPKVCACCGAPVRPDLWTDGLCAVCRNGRQAGSGHLARLGLDLGAKATPKAGSA